MANRYIFSWVLLICLLVPFLVESTPLTDLLSRRNATLAQVKALLKLNVNQPAEVGTPLFLAVEGGNIDIIKYLIKKGANPFGIDSGQYRMTALKLATSRTEPAYYKKIAGMLKTPVIESEMNSAISNYKKIVEILKDAEKSSALKTFKTPSVVKSTPLTDLLSRYDATLKQVKALFDLDIDESDKELGTPLFLAVESGNIDIVEYLIDKNVSLVGRGGRQYSHMTALALTALQNTPKSKQIAKILLEAGAASNLEDDKERSYDSLIKKAT